MRISRFAVCASLVLASVSMQPAGAVPIAVETFESYGAGANLNGGSGGTGWTSNWFAAGAHTTVQPQSLSDPKGLSNAAPPVSVIILANGTVQAVGTPGDVGNFLNRAFPATTDTLYMSLLVHVVNGVDSGDFYNFMVSNGATGNTNAGLGVGIRNNTNNPFFSRVGSSGSGDTDNSSTNAVAGQTFLLVAKFSKDGSANYNRTDLFINPTSLVEPGTPDAFSVSGVTGLSTLSLFSVRNFNPESGDTVFIDNIRFAATFADAIGVPEPGTVLLSLAGLASLAARRRRTA